jgi:hypothetical protein
LLARSDRHRRRAEAPGRGCVRNLNLIHLQLELDPKLPLRCPYVARIASSAAAANVKSFISLPFLVWDPLIIN